MNERLLPILRNTLVNNLLLIAAGTFASIVFDNIAYLNGFLGMRTPTGPTH